MKLDSWFIAGNAVFVGDDVYGAPEKKKISPKLGGIVSGHPGFLDGDSITTSSIQGMTIDGKIRTFSGSEYELGDPNPDYARMFPKPLERLKAAIPSVN